MDKVKLFALTNISGHLESVNHDDMLDSSDVRLIHQIIRNKKPIKKDVLKDRLVKIVERTLLDDTYNETVVLYAQYDGCELRITMTRNDRHNARPSGRLLKCLYRYVGFNKYDMLLTYTIHTMATNKRLSCLISLLHVKDPA